MPYKSLEQEIKGFCLFLEKFAISAAYSAYQGKVPADPGATLAEVLEFATQTYEQLGDQKRVMYDNLKKSDTQQQILQLI